MSIRRGRCCSPTYVSTISRYGTRRWSLLGTEVPDFNAFRPPLKLRTYATTTVTVARTIGSNRLRIEDRVRHASGLDEGHHALAGRPAGYASGSSTSLRPQWSAALQDEAVRIGPVVLMIGPPSRTMLVRRIASTTPALPLVEAMEPARGTSS